MNRLDIMTDIETFGTDGAVTFFQIAACAFDIETGRIISTFNQTINVEKEGNFIVNGKTLMFWMRNKDLLETLLKKGCNGSFTQKDLLNNFRTWFLELKDEENNRVFEESEKFLWGNGILFGATRSDLCAA